MQEYVQVMKVLTNFFENFQKERLDEEETLLRNIFLRINSEKIVSTKTRNIFCKTYGSESGKYRILSECICDRFGK